jgi:hypothetical protein
MARRPSTPQSAKPSGAMIGVNMLLVSVCIVVAYLKFGPHAAQAPPPPITSDATPAPVASAPSTPIPQLIAATPVPTPTPFSITALAANPSTWPPGVTLRQVASFPAIYNGQVVGSISVPAGTAVKLIGIEGNNLDIEYQGGRQKLPWNATDLEARVRASH